MTDSTPTNIIDQINQPMAESTQIPALLPVLPIRGTVAFPGTVMPLAIGRSASRRLLDDSLPESKIIALVTQRDEEEENPGSEALYEIGLAVTVLKMIRQPDESLSVIVHGLTRVRLTQFTQVKPYFIAKVDQLEEKAGSGKRFEAAVAQVREQARTLIEMSPNVPEDAVTLFMNIEAPSAMADFLGANLNLDVEQKQDLLENLDVAKRIRAVHQHVSTQLEILKLQQKIQQDVQSSIGESQRKHYMREQLKVIQKELADEDGGAGEIVGQLRKRLDDAKPPQKVMEEAHRELDRLEIIPPASPEYSMLLTYLELITDLPWSKASEDNLDLDRARRILDRDHYNLDKVKRRLIEYLAVRKLNPRGRSPIICLVGPPGVGKTSLGQSVADALGRQFARMSFGGIRDEAEIRGHRRTYIGAMPGRIIQEIRRAGTNNPVMMLDEIDKLGSDFRGDPASALLEVLDPRQNNAFVDRYLDVPFDLSQILFIATANYMGTVPPALQDRMEVIEIPGYTDHDKLAIARRYLTVRQLKENGLDKKRCRWRVPAIRKIVTDYTREAGVRELERQIGAVCRGVAAKVAARKKQTSRVWSVDQALVRKMLGPEQHLQDVSLRTIIPGVVLGLAYTPTGGDVLFVEATVFPGTGQVNFTGQMGDVMKESASTALSLFKSRSPNFKYNVHQLKGLDIHVHVPAGAVPKDGPSAGIAMFTAIASLLLDIRSVPRMAMTGEVTLRGLVLPVGGIKEKTLAAARAGIKTILLPKGNRKDHEEIDMQVRRSCRVIYVENVDQVLQHALGKSRLAKAIGANGRRHAGSENPNYKQAAQSAGANC